MPFISLNVRHGFNFMNTDFSSQAPFVSLVQFAMFTTDLFPRQCVCTSHNCSPNLDDKWLPVEDMGGKWMRGKADRGISHVYFD
jgi:hypothetical protein